MKPESVLSQQIQMAEETIATYWISAAEQARELTQTHPDIKQILLGGCGDSHHAALGLALAYSAYTDASVFAMEAMTLARYAPKVSKQETGSCLVIAISNSGEVARTIEAMDIWRTAGAQTIAFTSDRDSTLAKVAGQVLAIPSPAIAHGPGLLSYLGSLIMGYATLVFTLLRGEDCRLGELIAEIPERLHDWLPKQVALAEAFASNVEDGVAVFLGSGPARGSAHFGAAKVIEAAGERCWAQDVEEWAHLEYFCDPPSMPTILLSAQGRAHSRELEIIDAMHAIGRSILISEWVGGQGWTALEREILSPLALWAAPAVYANKRADILASQPFRGFGGGRSRQEGGGASRIRSSERMDFEGLNR